MDIIRAQPMSVARGFAIVLISGVGFAAGGGGIGYALARYAPFYYRGVFQGGDSPDFHPVQVGVGLGVSQGLIVGLIVGAIVVLAVTFSGSRQPAKGQLPADDEIARPRPRGCFHAALGLLAGALILLPIGLLIGLVMGEHGCRTERFSQEKKIMAAVLADDPSMSSIQIEMYTADGTAYLYGVVSTKNDRDRLRSQMKTLMGESRIDELMRAVSVRGE